MPYTKFEIIEIAERYHDKRSFREEQPTAYFRACRKGWLSDVTKHMVTEKKGPEPKNTKEKCRKAAKQYTTRVEFREQAHSLYVTAHKQGWLDEICAHMVCGIKQRWDAYHEAQNRGNTHEEENS